MPIQNPIQIGSIYSLIEKMELNTKGGQIYRKVKEALQRITLTGIVSKGVFYDKQDEQWIEDTFHLYERVIFKGRKLPDGSVADTNYLYLNSWYLDNINARYVKPIDWKYYRSLKTPIAQRLYEILSVKFYGVITRGDRCVSYRYSTLCDLLPVTRQNYLSLAMRIIDPAHEKLRETEFIGNWKWEETPQDNSDSDWIIRYYPGKRAKEEVTRFSGGIQLELELSPSYESHLLSNELDIPTIEDKVLIQLMQRGITKSVAEDLVGCFVLEQIQKQIEVFDHLVENKNSLVAKNPAGFLRKSIEENYQPPKEYLNQQNKMVQEEKEKDRKEHWLKYRKELIKQDMDNWDQIPLEKRIEGRLEFWITGEKMNGRSPTPEQIKIKKQELIDGLPQTDEDKFRYILQNYPEEPPNAFMNYKP